MLNSTIHFLHNPQVPAGQTGKRINNYIYSYNDLIGKGNFARVYRGHNQKAMEIVAIKIVSLDSLKSKRLEELIFEEIRILQQMNHPNILKFHEALLSERNCYIITELCNQGDLAERIKKKPIFSDIEFCRIVFDIYQGLRYLREMKVTHRDLKSANIFLHNAKAKIADFGLAKIYQQNFKDLDIGSPLYMSPEGIILNVYGEKTDVWAFGIIVYEMLHGQTPFCKCQSQTELKNQIVKPLPDYKFRKNISEMLKKFIMTCLEVNQAKRPNIYELANDPFMKLVLATAQPTQAKSNPSVSHYSSSTSPNKVIEQSQATQVPVTHFDLVRPHGNGNSDLIKNMLALRATPIIGKMNSIPNNYSSAKLEVPRTVSINKSVDNSNIPKDQYRTNPSRDDKTITFQNNLKVCETPQNSMANQPYIQQIYPPGKTPIHFNDKYTPMKRNCIISNEYSDFYSRMEQPKLKNREFSVHTIESTKESEQEQQYFMNNQIYFYGK